jgi:hypothetical protein
MLLSAWQVFDVCWVNLLGVAQVQETVQQQAG